jgi:hypothetical protein
VPEHPSLRIARPPTEPITGRLATKLPVGQANVREIFKGLVVASLDAGFLRYSRRQELMELAGRLAIGEFEASLLIAEAQFRSGEIDPVEFAETGLSPTPVPASISASTKIALALVVAAFVDVVVVCWLL